MGRGFPLSALSQEQRDHIRREDAKRSGAPVVSVGLKGHKPSRSVHTGKGAKKGPSKLEQRFMAWLDSEKAAGNVLAWAYEPIRVVLPAARATTKRDFLVRVAPSVSFGGPWVDVRGQLALIELKPADRATGRPYWRDASKLRTKLCAEVLRDLIAVLVVWPGGPNGWRFEFVEVRHGR